jgi:hypothetical protein
MRFIENTKTIETYKNDYGIPINFECEDFQIGDVIVFACNIPSVADKIFTVDNEEYSFGLKFTEQEALRAKVGQYKYSFKQYRNDQFLDTLLNGKLIIEETVLWRD